VEPLEDYKRSTVFIAVKINIIFFWIITPYNLVFTKDSEEHSSSPVLSSSLVMEAVYSCETSITPRVSTQNTTM
jgi:hypothetical protein